MNETLAQFRHKAEANIQEYRARKEAELALATPEEIERIVATVRAEELQKLRRQTLGERRERCNE
jgi:hypothetical protein